MGIYSWLDGRSYRGEWKDNNMDGYGIYKWNDGRVYQGEYRDDKKHGYGIYKWNDGREYQGHWALGKQHGLGKYLVFEKSEESGEQKLKTKFGLWEDGKRIEWFSDEMKDSILGNREDYRVHFVKDESSGLVPKVARFERPPGFDRDIKRVSEDLQKQYDSNHAKTLNPLPERR
jgi:hypothetical protein